MIKFFEVSISRTACKYQSEDDFEVYDSQVEKFKTIEEVKEFLNKEYYYADSKCPIFRDNAEGETIQVGHIYRMDKTEQYKVDGYLTQEDWVEISEVEMNRTPVLI